MKPIDAPDPKRDQQMDIGGEILDEALSKMENRGVEAEPVITLFLLTAANVALNVALDSNANPWDDAQAATARAQFEKEAGDAFDIAVQAWREENLSLGGPELSMKELLALEVARPSSSDEKEN